MPAVHDYVRRHHWIVLRDLHGKDRPEMDLHEMDLHEKVHRVTDRHVNVRWDEMSCSENEREARNVLRTVLPRMVVSVQNVAVRDFETAADFRANRPWDPDCLKNSSSGQRMSAAL
jgi:hypothetical protein